MTAQYVEIINEIVQKKRSLQATAKLDIHKKKNKQIEKNALTESETNVTYRNEKQYHKKTRSCRKVKLICLSC